MNFDINIEGGAKIRLLTAGKFCEKDIVITAGESGVQLPELENAAAELDIAQGKQAIDGDGNVVEGQLPVVGPGQSRTFTKLVPTYSDGVIEMSTSGQRDFIFAFGGKIAMQANGEEFGDADALDVRRGKTFTSANGLKKVGLYVPPNYSDMLPDLDSPATSGEVLLGKEFIDADGVKQVGTLVPGSGGGMETVIADISVYTGGSVVMYYMSADGLQFAESPVGQFTIVKNSPVVIIYDGSTSLTNQGGAGYISHYDNAWQYTGHSCAVLSFFEDGSVVYAEN